VGLGTRMAIASQWLSTPAAPPIRPPTPRSQLDRHNPSACWPTTLHRCQCCIRRFFRGTGDGIYDAVVLTGRSAGNAAPTSGRWQAGDQGRRTAHPECRAATQPINRDGFRRAEELSDPRCPKERSLAVRLIADVGLQRPQVRSARRKSLESVPVAEDVELLVFRL